MWRLPSKAGAVVFASEDPASQGWTPVSMPGFGGDNSEIYYLTAFNNHLYASTVNLVTGFEVWKTDGTRDGQLENMSGRASLRMALGIPGINTV